MVGDPSAESPFSSPQTAHVGSSWQAYVKAIRVVVLALRTLSLGNIEVQAKMVMASVSASTCMS